MNGKFGIFLICSNKSFLNFFENFFSNKEKYELFYNEITNKLTPNLGSTKNESGVNEDGSKWHKSTFTSKDGNFTSTTYVSGLNEWYPTSTNNVESTYELTNLKKSLNKAVENQNFEEAVKLRDLIKDYEKNSEKLIELKSKLDNAVKNQNFEEAIKLRDSIKKIETK